LCEWIPEVQQGLLLLQSHGNEYLPAAQWPAGTADLRALGETAQQALRSGDAVIQRPNPAHLIAAYPLLGPQQPYGCVVLVCKPMRDDALQQALKLLHWGGGWLVALLERREAQALTHKLDALQRSFDLELGALSEQEPSAAARVIVNQALGVFGAARASVGWVDPQYPTRGVRVQALSHTAYFDPRSDTLTQLTARMNDALDQARCVVSPGDASTTMAVPLLVNTEAIGVLMLEFEGALGDERRRALEPMAHTIGLALGPALKHQLRAQRSWWQHTRASLSASMSKVFGREHAGLKFIAACLTLALLIAALLPVPFRINAPVVLEGEMQRAAVAPFDGFIAQAPVRAGDEVKAGQVLARLDDRDLRLEQTRYRSETEVAQRKLREAMAAGDAVNVQLASAQRNQAQAQLTLIDEKLARIAITAPFDGIVVKGDLSQQIGSPVETGKLLFEVAPIDRYRLMLKVDERDVAYVKPGQKGKLVLSALAQEALKFQIQRVVPMTVSEEGAHFFRVEAQPQGDAAPTLRPGMEGVAKVDIESRSLLFVVTRRMTDWWRLQLWEWGL
jgi:RND family efflux transporter MFP subunit